MIRFAVPADAAAVADIHVDAWRAAYAGIVPDAELAALSKPRRAADWRRGLAADSRKVLLAEDDALVTGWVALGTERAGLGVAEGEILALYIRPDRWRRGLGRALLHEAERELWQRGHARIVLWVLERNRPARAFYEALGYTLDGDRKDLAFGAVTLVELRYGKERPATV